MLSVPNSCISINFYRINLITEIEPVNDKIDISGVIFKSTPIFYNDYQA